MTSRLPAYARADVPTEQTDVCHPDCFMKIQDKPPWVKREERCLARYEHQAHVGHTGAYLNDEQLWAHAWCDGRGRVTGG